ncbi:MAG: phosphate ABC transporter permease PstA [Spirochaetales bacterium]
MTEHMETLTVPVELANETVTLRKRNRTVALASYGNPFLWLMGGMLVIATVMVVGLLVLVLIAGSITFWPGKIVQFDVAGGVVYLGEITRQDTYSPSSEQIGQLPADFQEKARKYLENREGIAERYLVRTGNYELTNTHFHWVSDYEITKTEYPEWAVVWERTAWGRFYGTPVGFQIGSTKVADTSEKTMELFQKHFPEVRTKRDRIRKLEKEDLGAVNYRVEQARLQVRDRELRLAKLPPSERASAEKALKRALEKYEETKVKADSEYTALRKQIDTLKQEINEYVLLMKTSRGEEVAMPLGTIVRGYPANRLNFFQKLSIYLNRWAEFLTDEPREANSEGGVFPAIFGTVVMTLLMSLIVSPLGVIAALYLKEYAKKGPLVSAVRIALNNLAGVPSIVFGVFGLGFFCYFVGTTIDQLFFTAKLPNPTFGTGGVLWSSLTLTLLTLPVVIVASEEALSAVPNSMREGSYACGASKWQTIQRIVIPKAMPGILTGMILAMARGAGEVAPLMLVGAVKLAPELPIDGHFPFFHLERSFMHLGFHIYDVGFQSQNSEAAKPMVFTTTLLLIFIIFTLNLLAIYLRNRLYRKVSAREV